MTERDTDEVGTTRHDTAGVKRGKAPGGETRDHVAEASGVGARRRASGWRQAVSKTRHSAARAIWLLALAAALLLGLGALLVALKANPDNVLVAAATGAAGWLDGPFADVFTFDSRAREALVNWGLAAVAYLIGGGILARLVRP